MFTSHFFIVVVSILGFEIILGLWLAFMYGNLFEDFKAYHKAKNTLELSIKEWKRFRDSEQIKINKIGSKNIIETI